MLSVALHHLYRLPEHPTGRFARAQSPGVIGPDIRLIRWVIQWAVRSLGDEGNGAFREERQKRLAAFLKTKHAHIIKRAGFPLERRGYSQQRATA